MYALKRQPNDSMYKMIQFDFINGILYKMPTKGFDSIETAQFDLKNGISCEILENQCKNLPEWKQMCRFSSRDYFA